MFVEIVGRPKPAVRLSGRAADAAAALGVRSIDLSMTHSKGMAAAGAIALIEGCDTELASLMRVRERAGPARERR